MATCAIGIEWALARRRSMVGVVAPKIMLLGASDAERQQKKKRKKSRAAPA